MFQPQRLLEALSLALLLGVAAAYGEPVTTPAASPGPEATVAKLLAGLQKSLADNQKMSSEDLDSLTFSMAEAKEGPVNLQTVMLGYLQVFSLLADPAQPAAQVKGGSAEAPVKMIALPLVLSLDGDTWKVDLGATYEAWPEPLRKLIEARLNQLRGQAAQQTSQVMEVNDANFEEQVLKGQGLILVDFKADWCPTCVQERPVVQAAARAFAGQVKICSLDIDANKKTMQQYRIEAVPTLILFRGGEVVDRLTAYLDDAQLRQWIQQNQQ